MTISFLGVDERSKSAYQFFFAGLKKLQCQMLDDYTKAQICLLDKDSYDIQQQYETLLHNYPDKYILLLSLEEQACTHKKTFFIKKPVKRDALEESLKKIFHLLSADHEGDVEQANSLEKTSPDTAAEKSSQTAEKNVSHNSYTKIIVSGEDSVKAVENTQDNTLVTIKKNQKVSTANAGKLLRAENEQHFVGEQPNIDINNPEQLQKVFYEPNKLLPAIVEQACNKSRKSEQIIELNVSNLIFYFDYQEQKVYSTMGPGIIRPLCLIHHENNIKYSAKGKSFRNQLHAISQSNKNKTKKKTQEKQSWNMESFMWLITLWSSRGRVPQGTDLTQPVYLMQWPNLTRLASIPHAVRIAALLYAQPRTLIDTAKQLGIEQRYVFAFYSACKAIGLANISRREVDKLFAAEKPEQHRNQSILSKLLGKLTHFSHKSSMNEIA
ncbi:MAG: hypothetical protein QNL62_04895 [Gammaproteobacteria bacterium]|nr:hypothetical protein [Gammaproteobacteria bacterium]